MKTYTEAYTGNKIELSFIGYDFWNGEYHGMYIDINGNQWTGTNGKIVYKFH